MFILENTGVVGSMVSLPSLHMNNPSAKRRSREPFGRAAFRLEMAAVERTWAIHTAAAQGLCVRSIASAVGLGPTRVHQILTNNQGVPTEPAADGLRGAGWPAPEDGDVDPGVVAGRCCW